MTDLKRYLLPYLASNIIALGLLLRRAGWPRSAYAHFITGWFSRHIQDVVLAIALGQFAIAVLLIQRRPWRVLGVLGAMVFLLAIAPLGVGSAFPFSLIFIAAIVVMDRRRRYDAVVLHGDRTDRAVEA